MRFHVIAEVEASDLFEDDNINWQYCMEYATFAHKDACEFLLHCPIGEYAARARFIESTVSHMRKHGCTEEFIKTYNEACATGAYKLLLYV
jgi:hypothetical protein